MKKLSTLFLFLFALSFVSAQYFSVNSRLQSLEDKKGVRENVKNVNLEDTTFVLLKDFEDHSERQFLKINGVNSTYIEVFDDKASGDSTSNVFTGDLEKTESGFLSFRFDKLENEALPMPLVKSLLLTRQKNILYLRDVNTGERWIEESAIK